MGSYNYQVLGWPAQPRSKKRREANITSGGGTISSGGGADVDLFGYIRIADLIKTTSDASVSEFLDTNAMSSLMVKTLLDQKANTIHDHSSQLIRPAVMVIPQIDPSDAGFSLASGEVAEFISHDGSFAEPSGSVTPADLKDLTLKINGVTQTTYNPASQAQFNVDLTSCAQKSWVEAKNYLQGITKAMVENVLTGNITSHTHSQYLTSHQSLAGYATETWVQQQGYLTSHQSLADYALKTEIPTSMAWSAITGKPTKLSQFTNDIISSWALAATKPSYSWTEIASRPTTLSAFAEDATHRLVSDEQISGWNRAYGELIMGTQTAATGSWTGVSSLATASDMTSGYRFTYWLPYAGSGNATLTLTFGDGTTKTVNLYLRGASRLTTHFPAGSKIDFVYLESVSVAGSSTKYTGAWPDAYYDTTYSAGTKALFDAGTNTTNRVWSASVLASAVAAKEHSHLWADITDSPSKLSDFTNDLISSWALAATKPDYSWSEIGSKPTTLSGYGITDGYSSLSTTGSGNAITGVSGSGHALTFTKGNTFVDLASEQTISGKKHISYLDVTGALAIPQVEPTAESGKVFEYIDNSGSFGEAASAITPADLKDLVLKINGVTKTTYNPSSAASFNVDLTDYATQSWVEAKNYLQAITKAMVEAVLTGNITSHTHSQYLTSHQSLSGYATQTWVQQQGYLTSHQSLANYYTKTQADAKFLTEHQSLENYALKSEIPTSMAWTAITGRPTKLSQFTNDIISSWALAASKPSYSWSEIGSRPTTLASFSGDSTHRLVSDTQISNWNSAYGWGNHADAGYLTSFTESDPTVPAWAKAASKPSYSWSEIGSRPTKLSQFTNDILSDWALAATKPSYSWTEISSRPTTLSAFSDDATHRLVSDEQIASWDRSYGELIMGTQTAATGSWTGVSRLATAADMTSGYRFTYWLPYGGSGNASLTLTFGDGTTKTINLYIRGTSRLTTHYPAGTKIDFVYFENISIAGSSTLYTGAWPDAYYDSTIVDRLYSSYERTYLYSASDPLYRYKLCGFSSEGKIVPLTITNQTSGTIVDKTPTTVPLNPKKGIVYYNATTNITAATTRIGSLYSEIPMSTPHYTFNTSVPVDADIFLKGSYDEATGLFTLDTTSHTSWYVFALKSSGNNYDSVFVEGSCYMYVGPSSNTANYLQLKNDNPLYVFKNGKLIPLELSALTTTWSDIVGRPIKLSDFSNDIISSWALAATKPSYSFSELNNKPTTISGYGITDAKIQNGTITLGSSTITPLTSFTETDPTVPAWAKAASKPAYNLDEVSDGSTRKLSDYMLSSSFTKSAITTLLGNNTYAAYNANGYLPLSGGTLTGNLTTQANQTFDVTTATRSIYYTDSSNNTLRAMMFNNNGHLSIGYDGPGKGKSTYLDGTSVYFRFGASKNYTLTLSGDDGTLRSSTGANLLSIGYRSGNTIYPFKNIYSTFHIATKCLGATNGTVLYGVARFTIANTKKARTFAIKIPSSMGAYVTFKIVMYSPYNYCPASTITVNAGSFSLTSSSFCALYPSYSVEGSFAGRVAFARDGDTSSSNMYILLGSYGDGQQYQGGMIAIDSIIHSDTVANADTIMNFGYTLLDLDDETMFTKITECANADAHFKSVTVTDSVTAPKVDCTSMLLVPTGEPSSVPTGKVAEYIDLTSGSFAN